MLYSLVNKVKSLFGIEEEKKRRNDDEEDYYPAPKKRHVSRHFDQYRYKPGTGHDNYVGIERSGRKISSEEERSEISIDLRDEEEDEQYQSCFENGTPHQEQNYGRWTEMNSVRRGYEFMENQMGHPNHMVHQFQEDNLNSKNETTFRRSSTLDIERNNEHGRYLNDVTLGNTSNQFRSPQRMEDRHMLNSQITHNPFTRDMLVPHRIDGSYTRDTFVPQRMDSALVFNRRQSQPAHGYSGNNLPLQNLRRETIRPFHPMSQPQSCRFGNSLRLKKFLRKPPPLSDSRLINRKQNSRPEMEELPEIDAKDGGFKAYREMLQRLTKNKNEFSEQLFSGNEAQEFKMFEPQLQRNKSYFNVYVNKNIQENRQNRKVDIVDLTKIEETDDELEYPDSPVKSPHKKNISETLESEKLNEASCSQSVLEEHNKELIPNTSEVSTTNVTTYFHPQNDSEIISKNGMDTEFFENFFQKYTTDKGKPISEEDLESFKRMLSIENHKQGFDSIKDNLKKNVEITEDLDDISFVEKKDGLPELTPVMLSFVETAIKEGSSNSRFFCNANGVTAGDIRSLAGKNWLNDKVINAYMDLLVQRGQLEGYPSVCAFSTFFYMRLKNKGYSAVTRWTKMIDIFEQDILLVPLHLGIHWALCVVDFRQKSICYYDSMNAKNYGVLQRMLQYLKEEKENKKKECFNESDWVTTLVQDIPQQRNGYDCGVFTCVFAEYLARGTVKEDDNNDSTWICSYPPFPFSADDMGYFRKKIIYEILIGRILE